MSPYCYLHNVQSLQGAGLYLSDPENYDSGAETPTSPPSPLLDRWKDIDQTTRYRPLRSGKNGFVWGQHFSLEKNRVREASVTVQNEQDLRVEAEKDNPERRVEWRKYFDGRFSTGRGGLKCTNPPCIDLKFWANVITFNQVTLHVDQLYFPFGDFGKIGNCNTKLRTNFTHK